MRQDAYPGYPVERDIIKDEYQLRLTRARALMGQENLDALVVTSSAVGQARAALHTQLGRRGVLMLTGGTTHRPPLLSTVHELSVACIDNGCYEDQAVLLPTQHRLTQDGEDGRAR